MRNTLKYIGPVLGGAAFITAALFMPTWDELHPEPEATLFSDEYIAEINCMEDTVVIIEDETTTSIKGVNYGMPCETYQCTQRVESVERSEDEQTTAEEAETDADRAVREEVVEGHQADVQSTAAETQPVETVQTTAAPSMVETAGPVHEVDPQTVLRDALCDAGISYFWPYAWAQVQQESSWNPWAVSPDGKDKGLLQYREQYWNEPESIYDVDAQIRRYVREVSARLAAGLSIEETISRHYTSDYVTEINWDYVYHVLSWLNQ